MLLCNELLDVYYLILKYDPYDTEQITNFNVSKRIKYIIRIIYIG